MTRAFVFGLALIATAFLARGYIEAAAADAEDVKTWKQFREELVATRQAVRMAKAGIGQEWRQKECRFQSLREGIWTEMEERMVATCALAKWPAVTYDTLDRIIACESHWRRTAYNPSGPYVGLAQHVLSSWAGRLRTYSPKGWEMGLKSAWQNSRSMLIVTVRMMASVNIQDHWSCA